jgi:ATP-dependent Clp protease protease subunit
MKINKLMQLLRDNANVETPPAIRSEAQDDGTHIYVYDVIDSYWGASANMLVAALADSGGQTVHLHINSPGGDVFEARAMAAAIVGYEGDVIAHIDGVAASAATYLALSANEVRMTDGGLFMVHNSWTLAMGNASELLSTAALLEKIDGTIAADYAKKTGASAEQIKAWMDAETWFTAQEAQDAGFIDAIDPNTKGEKNAQWNLSAYDNAPKIEEPPQEPDLNEQVSAQLLHNRNRLRLMAQAQRI